MDNIKFKAWLPAEKMMCQVDGFDFPNQECTIYHNAFSFGQTTALIEEIIILQFTGLKDKNGIEIYEGDILKVYEVFETCEAEFIGPVYWNSFGWAVKENDNVDAPLALYDHTENWIGKDSEIMKIGNIYENPELIRGS